MSLWSAKRKFLYAGIPILFLVVVVGILGFLFFYENPTCFDGRQNGDETGVDCGGKCQLVCSAEAIDPIVRWSRAFRVTGGVYNAVSYVENPNVNSSANKVNYLFTFRDSKNVIIATRSGTVDIPKNKTFAIFEGPIDFGQTSPAKTEFYFTSDIVWSKDVSTVPDLSIKNNALSREDVAPRVDAFVENKSLNAVSNVEVVAIVFEDKDRAVGASRTLINRIPALGSTPIVFTWPRPFETGEESCAIPVDVMLLIDRSGSMDDISKNPPQPLTDVKEAAKAFVSELKSQDVGGLVSFASKISTPIDYPISFDLVGLGEAIMKISIGLTGPQNTNIGDAISKGAEELVNKKRDGSNQVMVLLTDGLATEPEKRGDVKYPEFYALEKATFAKQSGVNMFTIGLGKDINVDFLKNIASKPEQMFSAPTTEELNAIYMQIASSICKKQPRIVEIIPRIINR